MVPASLPAVLVAVAFAPCLDNEFLAWDDDENFLNNPFYRGLGWPQIRWAWTSFRIGVYQPLSWVILEAQYVLFSLRPGPTISPVSSCTPSIPSSSSC